MFFFTALFDIIGTSIYWYVLIRIVFGSTWIYLAIDIGNMTIILWHW